jgi:hypothetical protein
MPACTTQPCRGWTARPTIPDASFSNNLGPSTTGTEGLFVTWWTMLLYLSDALQSHTFEMKSWAVAPAVERDVDW